MTHSRETSTRPSSNARRAVSGLLFLLALVHLPPLSGALGASQLQALYGVTLEDPNLVLLMRHRAVLFGLVGLFFLAAAWKRELHGAALAAAWITVGTFVLLSRQVGDLHAELERVVAVDLVALLPIAVGTVAHLRLRDRGE